MLKLDLQSKAINISGSPKVRVEVEKVVKPFSFTRLEAVDISNPKRFANAGETLYYINKSEITNEFKKTSFKIIVNPNVTIDEILKQNLKWKFNGIEDDNKNNVKNFNVDITEKFNVKVTGIAGFPNLSTKNVNVKWIEEKKEIKSFASKISGLLKILEIINTVSEKVESVAPCKVVFLKDFNNSLVWKKENFNEEDKDSRHILDIKRFEFQLKVNDLALLECSKKIGVSFFGYDIKLGEIYFKLGVGSDISIRNDNVCYLEDYKFKNDKNTS